MSLEKLDISPFIVMLGSTDAFEEQAYGYSKNVVDSLKTLFDKKEKRKKKGEKNNRKEGSEENDEHGGAVGVEFEQELRYLLYLDCLLKFIKSFKSKNYKSPVANDMKQRYEFAGGFSLCINEAIILCLSVNEYKLDLSKLAYDTDQQLSLLISHAKSVGCIKHQDTAEDFYKLVAPFRTEGKKPFKGGKKRK